MKTTSILSSKLFAVAALAFLGMNLASCSATDEPMAAETAETVTDAQITFTYTVPDDLLRYAEITVCYNNDEGTDARWQPMLDNTFTLTYNLSKFPETAPIVMVYDRTNRPAGGVNVDWDLKMNVEVTMNIGGKKVTRSNSEVYTLSGDLGAGIAQLQKNVLDRTYAVKISKTGDVQFVH